MNVQTTQEYGFARKSHYSTEELFHCGNGLWGNAPRLPLPPMLMFDRIIAIHDSGGEFDKGYAIADMKVRPDLWFFSSHFLDDPVMPGCLQLDALWQLTGFFAGWVGGTGKGRAIGSGTSKFRAEITPDSRLVTYRIDIRKKVVTGTRAHVVAEGTIFCDDQRVGMVNELAVMVVQH